MMLLLQDSAVQGLYFYSILPEIHAAVTFAVKPLAKLLLLVVSVSCCQQQNPRKMFIFRFRQGGIVSWN